MPPLHPAHVFWLFGLSGAGKSTLAALLAADLKSRDLGVLSLDGDVMRGGLCRGLGFSDADRAENLRRSAEVARIALMSNLCVIAAFITPLEAHRAMVADIIGPDRISPVLIDASLEVCRARDVKGLYAGASAGKVAQLTGVSSGFEPPKRADLIVHTDRENVAASAGHLIEFARQRLGC
jgi:adenylyl-sulfate kinase